MDKDDLFYIRTGEHSVYSLNENQNKILKDCLSYFILNSCQVYLHFISHRCSTELSTKLISRLSDSVDLYFMMFKDLDTSILTMVHKCQEIFENEKKK